MDESDGAEIFDEHVRAVVSELSNLSPLQFMYPENCIWISRVMAYRAKRGDNLPILRVIRQTVELFSRISADLDEDCLPLPNEVLQGACQRFPEHCGRFC